MSLRFSPQAAIFGGFFAFYFLDKTMRVLNASDESGSGGHSHSHSHHHHAPVEAVSSALDNKSSSSEGLRQRKEKSEELEVAVDEKKGKEVSASLRLSAYLNLFGDFSKRNLFIQDLFIQHGSDPDLLVFFSPQYHGRTSRFQLLDRLETNTYELPILLRLWRRPFTQVLSLVQSRPLQLSVTKSLTRYEQTPSGRLHDRSGTHCLRRFLDRRLLDPHQVGIHEKTSHDLSIHHRYRSVCWYILGYLDR